MKTKVITLFTAILFIAGTGMSKKTTVFSEDKKEECKVADFSEMSISVSADVELRQGNASKVILEGDEDDLDNIETKVKGDKLIIKSKRSFNFGWNDRVKIYITTREIEEIDVSGSADVKGKTKISSQDIELEVSGSGKIDLPELESSKIEASISGSGNIVLGGKKTARELEVDISGSGKMDAEQLTAETGDIEISGSGKCRVDISNSLKAGISGSGRVNYKGNPTVNADISGSGKVRPYD